MASVIIMPKQGLLMEEGTITAWLKNEGDKINENEPLFEMETDKLTITMESTATGTILKILHGVGDVVPITKPIAIVGEPGEDISSLLGDEAPAAAPAEEKKEEAPAAASAPEAAPAPAAAPAPQRAPGEKVFASPRAKLRAEENGVDIALVAGTGPDGIIVEKDVLDYVANKPAISPLAANVAAANGIDTTGIQGSGPNGKIMTADLPGAAPAEAAAPAAAAPAASCSGRGTRTEKMNGMRKAVYKNMLNSKNVNAQTNVKMAINMEQAKALREQYKALGIKVSYNDIIVRACAKALMDYPICNASTDGENVIYHDYANVGLAVSVGEGLIVPVCKDADMIGLKAIAEKNAENIEKARDGKLAPDDYSGGTFTVSSLGSFDVDDFVAIINAPESCILAVSRINKTPVVETNAEGEDVIAIRSLCNMSLSFDHRIVNGTDAAKFLKQVKTYLENPIMMI